MIRAILITLIILDAAYIMLLYIINKYYEKILKQIDKVIFYAFTILARKNKLEEWQNKEGEIKLQRYLNSVLEQNGFSSLIKDFTIKNDFPVSVKYEYKFSTLFRQYRRRCRLKFSALVWLLKQSMKAEETMQMKNNDKLNAVKHL